MNLQSGTIKLITSMIKKYTDLIEILEKLFGKGAVSRTIGTRTNVVRFPKGKQGLDPTKSEFDVEGSAAKNPDLAQTIENSIEDRMGDITQMNDQELLTYTANARRLLNFKEPPSLPEADIVKFGSGQEIKGKGLEQLIEKQGTKNPPTTVAGQLETQGKKLEKAGEDLKEITEPRSLVGDMLKDYADFDKYMQSSQKTGYVRATVRQIMREDIQAGKLKLPKELQDQVMQGIGEPIDIYRKVYGEGALEQIDSLADDLGQFRTEEEAAKFARSKFEFTPKLDRPKESYTTEEMKKITSLEDPSKPYKPFGSDFTRQEKVDWLIKNVDQEAEVTIPSPEFLQNMLDSGREDLIDHFWEIHTRNIGSKPVINIDTGNLKNPALVKAMMEDRAKKPKLVFSKEKVVEDSVDDAGKINKDDLEPEGKADGGRIGFNKGKRVLTEIDKLIEKLNKKTKGKKSMESVNPKTGEVTVPKKPIRRAEEPTGTTVMDPEPEIIDERAIPKKPIATTRTTADIEKEIDELSTTPITTLEMKRKYNDLHSEFINSLDPRRQKKALDYRRKSLDTENRLLLKAEEQGLDFDTFEKLRQGLYGPRKQQTLNYIKTGKVNIEPVKPTTTFEEVQKRYRTAAKAADEIFPNYNQPKTAANSLAEVMAEQKYGKVFDDLSGDKQQELYEEAYDYITSINRLDKVPPPNRIAPPGQEFNISDPKTAEAFTNFAKENDPEGFKKIQKIVDDINNKNALEEFDITGREPNANGGIAGLL